MLVLGTAVVLGLLIRVVCNIPKVYEAQAILGLRIRQIPGKAKVEMLQADLNVFFDTQVELAVSDPVIKRVLADLMVEGSKTKAFELPEYVNSAIRYLRLERPRNTSKLALPALTRTERLGNCLILTVKSTDPAYARGFAATWAKEFITFKNQRMNTFRSTQIVPMRQILDGARQLEKVRDMLTTLECSADGGAEKFHTGIILDSEYERLANEERTITLNLEQSRRELQEIYDSEEDPRFFVIESN